MSSNDDDRAGGDSRADRQRRQRIRNKHANAAADGIHLPSLRELLLGSPWLSRDQEADSKTWAERVLRRVDRTTEHGKFLAELLESVTVSPVAHDFAAAADAFGKIAVPKNYRFGELIGTDESARYQGPDAAECAKRLDFYAACYGHEPSCIRVAQHAMSLSRGSTTPVDECADFAEAALGWLGIADERRPNSRSARAYYIGGERMRHEAGTYGSIAVAEIMTAHGYRAADAAQPAKPASPNGRLRKDDGGRALDWDCDIVELRGELPDDEEAEPEKPDGILVLRAVGNSGTREGQKVEEAYKPIIGTHLPLVKTPDLASVRSVLANEFPHAASVTEALLRGLENREFVRFSPMVFVGEPGCGKTTYAARLLTLLSINHQLFPCGGVSDASLAGCARQWSTGSPSLCVSLISRYRTATPGIVLDEINRVSTGTTNGNLLDALLSMMEPVSASRYLDPYLQAEVDLSHVIWLATCNDVDGLSAALRDRCRIIKFPSPGPEHLSVLAASLLRRAVDERGLAPAWALPLDATELAALAENWNGGSIRRLQRLVGAVLDARDFVGTPS